MSLSALPRHVAIIMDGNGRWAKKNAFSVMLGHRKGVEALRDIIRYSSDAGIQVLSLYAFSTENWTRPEAEVKALMGLIVEFFTSEIEELHRNKVKIRILGDVEALPDKARAAVISAMDTTKDNGGLQLNIALNYGARDEILRAVKSLAMKSADQLLQPQDITWADFAQELYTKDQPDVDLLIRTSGEQRLSNFLLCQSAYAELLFPETLWPEFTVSLYKDALATYQRRERRFGGRT
ncbi:MAG: isoprenyl transferase [Clostridiales bacterium]|nr:isoprenyl transferase [Clostridiales bacterium]